MMDAACLERLNYELDRDAEIREVNHIRFARLHRIFDAFDLEN